MAQFPKPALLLDHRLGLARALIDCWWEAAPVTADIAALSGDELLVIWGRIRAKASCGNLRLAR